MRTCTLLLSWSQFKCEAERSKVGMLPEEGRVTAHTVVHSHVIMVQVDSTEGLKTHIRDI